MKNRFFNNIKLLKPVVLVGLMGCGKSSIGLRLAKQLAIPFTDLDKVIENETGLSCTDIFAKYGEAHFRKLEYQFMEKLLNMKPHIIASGGGTYTIYDTRYLIHKKSTSIWIRADFDILLERVSRKNNRPLLENGNKAQILKELMEKRYPIYSNADIIVDTSNNGFEDTIFKILSNLEKIYGNN